MRPYYEDEFTTIYNGDCREVWPQLGKVDAVITDPPYGIAHGTHGQVFRDARPIIGDNSLDSYALLNTCNVTLAAFFSPYSPPPIKWRSVLVWDKGAHVGIGGDRETCWKRDYELIGIRGNGPLSGYRDSAVLRFAALLPPPSGHFAEKPIALMAYLMRKLITKPDTVVLDPFMGSGTTLRAAKDMGHKAIGIEIDEKYCEIAAKRMAQRVLWEIA